MTHQIRKAVFETNSSSSHSLTLGKGDLVAMPLPKKALRDGTIELHAGHYGWEWHRYYTPVEKMNYLLTQMAGERIPDGSPKDNAQELADMDERFAMLCQVVKEYTGCDVTVASGNGDVDHDSSGVGMELFNSAETLRNFLFDQTSFVQTSNDNSSPPWSISTDRGTDELCYSYAFRDVPDDYVTVTLYGMTRYGRITGFSTKDGGVVSEHVNPELAAQLQACGVALSASWKERSDYRSFMEADNVRGATAAKIADTGDCRLGLARDFTASLEFERTRPNEEASTVVAVKVAMPAELAKALKELPKDGLVRAQLSEATRDLGYWRKRAEETRQRAAKDPSATPDDWALKNESRYAGIVAKLESQLTALQKKAAGKKSGSTETKTAVTRKTSSSRAKRSS